MAKRKKKKNYNYLYLIIGLIFLIFSGVLFYSSTYLKKQDKDQSIYLNNLIDDGNRANMNTYLDIYAIELFVAKSNVNDDLRIYIVSDDKYYYLAAFNEEIYNKIKDSDLNNKPYRIYGKSVSIDNSLKNIIINAYNTDSYPDNDITEEDFLGIYGGIYIDTTYVNNTITILNNISLVCLIISIILIIIYLILLLITIYKKHHKTK